MMEEAKRLSELETKAPGKQFDFAGGGGTALIDYTI